MIKYTNDGAFVLKNGEIMGVDELLLALRKADSVMEELTNLSLLEESCDSAECVLGEVFNTLNQLRVNQTHKRVGL